VLPLGISTAAAGLYQKDFLSLPFPSEKPEKQDRTVIIWGGSSSVGSCAIQLAVASGLDVVTTASSRNFDYVKKLGANAAYDYHDNDVEDQVVNALEGKTIVGGYHAVGADGAVQALARIVDRCKGKAIVVTVRGVPDKGIPSSVRAKGSEWRSASSSLCSVTDEQKVSSSTIFNNEVGPYIWRKFLPQALKSGTIVPAPDPLVVGEELRSVQLGLDKQKAGVSAAKVVVTNIS
jgi:NADPH:quinone reductase-like Zn-dependent oxidoreductase